MRRVATSYLVFMATVVGLGTATIEIGKAESLAALATEGGASSETSNYLMAQLFYPPVTDPSALRVPGRGRASEPANLGRLIFEFEDSNFPESLPEGTLFYSEVAQKPLTKDSFEAIVDALVASGVTTEAIEVKITSPRPSVLPFPFPSTGTPGSAKILVKVEQPTRERLEPIVTTISEATSKNDSLSISSVNVQYFAKDCEVLERAAYQAAVRDAQNRASAIAEAMGATMRGVGSVAEPFYKVYFSGCNNDASLPFVGDDTSPYDPDAPMEIEVNKEIFVTFPVE